MTTFTQGIIGGVNYATGTNAPLLKAEVTRTIGAVGTWEVLLRNTGGIYNNAFDVQDNFILWVNGFDVIVDNGAVDGPAVTFRNVDSESIWDEYAVVRGVDSAQDLLFHNDYDYNYPNTATLLKTVLHEMFNHAPPNGIGGITNIIYDGIQPNGAPAANYTVGAFEFREGASFLTQLQELVRRAGHVFYVGDNYHFYHGQPGFAAAAAPSTFTSIAGSALNNIIGEVDYQKHDGDKHYNYVKLRGKAPMFDGYTEYNAALWNSTTGDNPINDTATVMVGAYSQVVYNHNPVNVNLVHRLTTAATSNVLHYTSWDFSDGEIGIWARYDDIAAAPGSPVPGAGTSVGDHHHVECRLVDNAGSIAIYYGDSSTIYEDHWGYCTFPLGESNNVAVVTPNEWRVILGADFNWDDVREMHFTCPGETGAVGYPSHFYIDGISLPFPVVSIVPTTAAVGGEPSYFPAARTAQTTYRRRPYIDSWPHIRTQNAMYNCATQILAQSYSPSLRKLKFMTPGNANLRYAGQTINVCIPSLDIDDGVTPPGPAVYYITQLHHVIEPMVDVSGGYGFDWVTEVECLPISGVSYDQSRLGIGSMYSPSQRVSRGGGGASRR